MSVQLLVESYPADSQVQGCMAAIVLVAMERVRELFAFGTATSRGKFVARLCRTERIRSRPRCALLDRLGKVGYLDLRSRTYGHAPLDDVAKLAHISRPIVRHQRRLSSFCHAGHPAPVMAMKLGHI